MSDSIDNSPVSRRRTLKKKRAFKERDYIASRTLTDITSVKRTVDDLWCFFFIIIPFWCFAMVGWFLYSNMHPDQPTHDTMLRDQIESVLSYKWHTKENFLKGDVSYDEFKKTRDEFLGELYDNCPDLVSVVIPNKKLLYTTKISRGDYKQMKTYLKILDKIPERVSCEYIEKEYEKMFFKMDNEDQEPNLDV